MCVSEGETESDLITGFPSSNRSWLVVLIFINCFTFFGNFLMIYGVLSTKRFRNPPHYFLISLSTSDLLVSILVMPLGIVTAVRGSWDLGGGLCHFWLVVDMACCSASVLNLTLISFDKYLSIIKPLRYVNIQTLRSSLLLIAVVWTESLLTASVPLFGWWKEKNHPDIEVCVFSWFFPTFYFIFLVSINLLLPLTIMLYVYAKIYAAARRQLHQISNLFARYHQRNVAVDIMRQNKASKRLGMLLGVFVLCWSPYLTVTFFLQFCTLCRIHPFVVDIVTWLAWSNSSFNPVLYSWLSREYRMMYKRLFGCQTRLGQPRVHTSRSEANANTMGDS